MKYKVGDKVQIKSIDWYNKNKDEFNMVKLEYNFTQYMSKFCSKSATIVEIITNNIKSYYHLDVDDSRCLWMDEMFEENVKDMETKEIILPEGWEVDKIENGKIVLKETKKELPKTWKECCKLLGEGEFIDSCSNISHMYLGSSVDYSDKSTIPVGLGKSMLALMQLLICRQVYRQGWKPDWTDGSYKYGIESFNGTLHTIDLINSSKILSFQSPEVRDEFLENFKDLIKEAKELL